jgi:hypothetical protein
MFTEPTEIVKQLEQTFKVKSSLSQVCYYDPKYGKISAELKALFEETREKFLKEISAIPIANEAYRIRVLQNALERQLGSRIINEPLVLDILEQAAKERGKMFTNRREFTGANGKPLFDPLMLARTVMDDLIKEGWEAGDAVRFVAERYKVAENELVTITAPDANN